MTKRLVAFLAQIVILPLFLIWKICHACTGRETLFVTFSQMLSLFPGKIGVYLRRAFYRLIFRECADDICVGFGTFFSHTNVNIGKGVYIGSGCTIGMVKIGDGVMIGSNVDILSGRLQHIRDPQNRLSDSDKGIFEQIKIGEHSWIGNSSVVLGDVGNACTVGAGSVIVKSVPDGRTVAGNPARIIGESLTA